MRRRHRRAPWLSLVALTSACSTAYSPLDEALVRAVMTGDSPAAVRALDDGANPTLRSPSGNPLVAVAVQQGDKAVLERMIQTPHGAELKQFALHLAAFDINLEMIDFLLTQGADPNYGDDNGTVALHLAAASPSPAAVERLLAAGANVHATNDKGTTALIVAASNGYTRTARALIAAGGDPNHQDRTGASAVSWATARNDSEMLAALPAGGGTAPAQAPSLPDLKQAARAQSAGTLEVRTGSVTTDGRQLKIRGSVVNRFPEVVDGMYLRVLVVSRDGARVLDTFRDESDARLPPGETGPLRLDISTMYAATSPGFVVEARPRRLGDSDYPLPADW